ncbi:NAD(P)H-dependent flavin oxidoreductase [Nonomuraea typhae]|uniref:Propionate 3-nitronate monooxygenase n=1 Tax=Nonomuraea typhae TaxID=2603600 RepID=A0ABW7Z5Q8_9ACTN
MGRLTDLLGIEHPVVQGPFGGGLSSVALAAAVSGAGGLGSYGGHILTPAGLDALVTELKAATARPFAVNLWVPQPGEAEARAVPEDVERLRPYYTELGVTPPGPPAHPGSGAASTGAVSGPGAASTGALPGRGAASTGALSGPDSGAVSPGAPVRPGSPGTVLPGPDPHPDFAEQAEALLAAAPPVISFVMGVPPAWVLEGARRAGVITIGTATTVEEALALQEAGLDAVVASGSDAGGHRGAFLRPVRESLVGTFSLVPQVADAVKVPVIAAGGIADRRGVRAALALGADGVQVGTAFLAAAESGASAVHKAALLGPEARVTVLTRLFSGRTARAIPNRFLREMEAHEDRVPPYPVQNALMLPIRRAAGAAGQPGLVNLWSGQAAPLARAAKAADILAALAGEQ